MSNFDEKKTLDLAKRLRKNILEMSLVAGGAGSHFGGALSCIDIIAVLFQNIINYNKDNFKDLLRDRFILSKGHACMALYSMLYELNILNKEELQSFEKPQSILLGHPVKNLDKGIEVSTGSLGMGVSVSMGFAIAAKEKKIENKIYTILGDGECNEGSVWEVALSAPKFNLDNLVVIIDRNNFQQTGASNDILDLNSLSSKWKSFNWQVWQKLMVIIFGEIYEALTKKTKLPKVIVITQLKEKDLVFQRIIMIGTTKY